MSPSGESATSDLDFIYAKMMVISGALGTSPLIYAAVILMLSRSMPGEAPISGPGLTWALVAAGALALAAALAARSLLLDPVRLSRRIQASAPRPGQPAAYAPIMIAQAAPMMAAEAAGVLGIVLFILTRDLLGSFLLAGISFSGMLMLAPRKSALAELLGRLAALDRGRTG